MGAVYFINRHFLSNAHPCETDCRDVEGGATVTLFSVDAAFNYMKAQFFGDWDSARCILATAAQRRLARSPCSITTHWMCSADSFVPPGQQWASWYKLHQLASARAL